MAKESSFQSKVIREIKDIFPAFLLPEADLFPGGSLL